MALPYVFNNSVFAAGFLGTDDGGAPTNATHSFSIDDTYSYAVTINGTINKPGDTVTIAYEVPGAAAPTIQTLTATQYDNPNMLLLIGTNGVPGKEDGTTNRFVLSNVMLYGNPPPTGQTRSRFADDGDSTLDNYTVQCFATGTNIRTVRAGVEAGVAVEDLRVGDLAVTASGAHRPIIWIGRRTIDCASHPRANEVLPVRIAAHALAENRPARDLFVSPGHSIAVDLLGEVLIPASSLINGTTIRQESVERITYWHVELESHDLLMAENLPTESYMEMGTGGFFPRNGEATTLHGVPDPVAATHADFCRPFHAAGPLVDFVRDRLNARALQLDWVQVENPLADLHLVVDGRRIDGDVQGLSACFLVPATAETVWLASDTVVPAMVGGGADLRSLGVCVGQFVIDDGFGYQTVQADDPRLCAGFHHVEEGPQRWTAGRALLPASLWESCRGAFFLRVDLSRPALPRWTRPDVASGEPLALAS